MPNHPSPTPPAEAARYFHGGAPGLRPGDLLTPRPPHAHCGCGTCAAKARGEQPYVQGLGNIDPLTGRPDRIYITTDRPYALHYASQYPRGGLYVVEPLDEAGRPLVVLEPSAEDRFPTWAVPQARVRSVVDPCAQMTHAQRRGLYRRWEAADLAADPARYVAGQLGLRQAAADPNCSPEVARTAALAEAARAGKARR